MAVRRLVLILGILFFCGCVAASPSPAPQEQAIPSVAHQHTPDDTSVAHLVTCEDGSLEYSEGGAGMRFTPPGIINDRGVEGVYWSCSCEERWKPLPHRVYPGGVFDLALPSIKGDVIVRIVLKKQDGRAPSPHSDELRYLQRVVDNYSTESVKLYWHPGDTWTPLS